MPRSTKPDNDRHSATPAGSTRLPSLPLRRRCRSAETDSVGPLASLRRVAAEHTGPRLFVVAIVLAAVFIASTDAAGTLRPAETADGEAAGERVQRMVRARGAGPSSAVSAPTPVATETPANAKSPSRSRATKTPVRPAFVWPADGWLVQGISPAHPAGIDIGLNTGDPVMSVRDGRVIFAGGDPCCVYGNFVIVEHDQGWTSLYAHLSAFAVRQGDQVKQGQVLGLAGATGKVTGAHLHFELRSYGRPVDPLRHFEGGAELLVAAAFVYQPPASLPAAPPASLPAAPPAVVPAATQPPPTPLPAIATPIASSGPAQAIAEALALLARQTPLGYVVDEGSCGASPTADAQWLVTCTARAPGCEDEAVCVIALPVCVIEAPLTVWRC